MKSSILNSTLRAFCLLLIGSAITVLAAPATRAQDNLSANGKQLYDQIKAASLTGGSAEVQGLTLRRDRVEMVFTGTFIFGAPVDGHVTTAVFVGQGSFRAVVPSTKFEVDNLKRILGTDAVDSDFKTAVLRFSDDTFDYIGKNRHEGGPPTDTAQKLVVENENSILRETGANLSARVALSLLNKETPGFFFATFNGGSRNRFSFVYDHQNRIPVTSFRLNGGERGVIFSYQDQLVGNDIWMAFYSLDDYKRNAAEYSDVYNLVDITHYGIDLNLLDPSKRLGMVCRIQATTRSADLRAISFQIG